MLDLFVSRGLESVSFSLFTKPTSIWQPLGLESCHHPSIHVHWPIAQCNRIRERFSDKAAAESEVSKFRRRYQIETGGIDICAKQPKRHPNLSTSWLVLPFDFVIGTSRIQRAIDRIRVPCNGAFERVRVSWTLANNHLMHLLRRNRS